MAKEDVIKHFRTPTPGRAPTALELELGEWFINYADGHAYLKDADGNIRQFRELQEATFYINSNGTYTFSVLATATKVLIFILNQLDYSEFVSITPTGSGTVVYDYNAAQYTTEIGDYVRIVYF